MLATSPDPTLRNGPEALALATDLCKKTQYGNVQYLDTLAAAYAAAGRFDAAVATSERAAAIADQRGVSGLAGEIRSRSALYREGRDYVEGR